MKQRNLLVVDDEPDIRELISMHAQKIGARVFLAENGEAALRVIEREHLDAIVSDINMPKMNGIDFLAKIRSQGNMIPFVIVTGYGDKDLAIKALKLGAFEFLEKPWDENEIESVLLRALELGAELNFWKGDSDAEAGLDGEAKNSATKSIAILEKMLKMVMQENNLLKNKNKSEE